MLGTTEGVINKTKEPDTSKPTPLAQTIAELNAEVRAAGLTDAEIDAELTAYKAERRDRNR